MEQVRYRRKAGRDSGGIEATGVLDSRILPDTEFSEQWESIIIDQVIKDRLLGQAILNFTARSKVPRSRVPLHGLILLQGPPGTGKTSLARGLASRTAECLKGHELFRYIEVEPHSLTSAALGKSQRAVTDFFGSTVAEAAAMGPLVVLLDEVETLAANRSKLSLQSNPIDVHRASDAVLAQVDHLADRHSNLLFIATSNFREAVDPALISRADHVSFIERPGPSAVRAILKDTLEALAQPFPALCAISRSPELDQVSRSCEGLDGRQIRKLVVAACTFDKETALDPGKLKASDLLVAADDLQRSLGERGD